MRVSQWFRSAAAAAWLLVAGTVGAAPCGGFTDVDSTDPNVSAESCASVQWMKNRLVTGGCNQTGTLYCPGLNVNRLQMALFMKRLGEVLTPADLGVIANDSNNVPVDLTVAADQIRCPMLSDIPAANYPRRVLFNNKVNLYNPTARVDILAEVVFSTNAGVSWIAVPDSKTYQTLDVNSPVVDNVSTYQLGFYDINPGTNYRFALRVMRNPDVFPPNTAGTGNVAIYCINRPSVISRVNASPPPFDISIDAPPRTGRAELPPGE